MINSVNYHQESGMMSRPEKGAQVMGFGDLKQIYTNMGNYKEGFLGFCKLIDKCNGNLSKMFNLFDEKTKRAFSKINKGKELKTNKEIIEAVKKAQTEKSASLKIINNFFANEKNAIHNTARRIKGLTETLYILFVSAFLGWFLPWFNIVYTRYLYLNKPQKMPENNKSNQMKPITIETPCQPTALTSSIIPTKTQRRIFSNFIK